jgi:DNA-binding SARP family transcriptional activator
VKLVLRLHVLGGLALEVDGTQVELPTSRRARSLLAWLALNRGRHSRVEIAGRFWPDLPESSARGNLRLALWAIRRALGPTADSWLVATRNEVGLAANGSVWVDLSDFRRLLDEGRYEEAVALCRGEPLAELEDEWAYDARDEHREHVLEALGRLADEAEGRGDLRQAIAWTRRQIALDPLGEEACRELMRRLAAAGNLGAAVQAFERLRERLTGELGIAPSPATRRLAYELAQAGETPLPAPEPLQPPTPRAAAAADDLPGAEAVADLPPPLARSARTAFVGRQDELEWLRGQWTRAAGGECRTVLLGGEAGIGKSRLAAEFAREVAARGAHVLFGRTDEDTIVPFQPFVEAVGRHVEVAPLDDLRTALGSGAEDLATLIPELERRLPDLRPRAGRPETQRYLMFEAVASLIRELSRSRPVLLVLEDLQWADRPTLLLFKHLARSADPAALLVFGTFREAEPDAATSVLEVLADLRRDAVVSRLSIAGLARAEIGELFASWSDVEAPPALIRALHEDTGGNPFFVQEIIRHLDEAGILRVDESRWSSRISLEDVGVPEGVKAVVARRLAVLGSPCRLLLDLGAVVGRSFELELLERLSGKSADWIAEVLEEAVAARVLTEDSAVAGGRYAFSHALVRETLYERLTRTRRVRLHRAIAEALEDLYGRDPGPHLGDLAYHALKAARPRDAEQASAYAREAGEYAMRVLAYEDAAAHFHRALQALESSPEPSADGRCELLLALGDALAKGGEAEEAAAAFEAAAAVARENGREDLLARAVLGFAGSWTLSRVGVEPMSVSLLEEALDTVGSAHPVLRARLLTRLSEELYYTPERERRVELSAEALRHAQRSGDKAALAAALGARHTAIWGQQPAENRREVARKMAQLGDDASDPEIALQAAAWSFADLLELGDLEEADAGLARVVQLAEELRQPAYRWWAHMLSATRAHLAGEFAEAESRLHEAGLWGRRAHIPTAEMYEAGQLCFLRLEQGRAGEVVELMQRVAPLYPAVTSIRCMLAQACAEAGLEDEAREYLQSMTSDEAAQSMMNASWSVGMYALAMACTRLGDTDLAPRLYRALSPLENYCHVAFRGATFQGAVARTLGVLAATAGRHEEAERHLSRAIEQNESMGALPQLARAQRDLGLLLRSRGDADKATALLESARALGTRLGMGDLTRLDA